MSTNSDAGLNLRWILLYLLLASTGLIAGVQVLSFATTAAAPANASPPLNELLKARFQTATNLLTLEERRLEEGRATLLQVCEAARRVRDSALELPVSPGERIAALRNYVAITTRLENSISEAVEKGASPLSERESARYLRLDAQIALARAELQANH